MKKVSTLAPQGAERRFERKLKQQPARVRKPQYKVFKYPKRFVGGIQMAQHPTMWFNKIMMGHRMKDYFMSQIKYTLEVSRFPKNDPAIVAIRATLDMINKACLAISDGGTISFTPVPGASKLMYVEPPPVDTISFGTKEILAKYQID